VTKTNRFTLIATFLLGVLLYMILRFAHDLNVAWDGDMREPPPITADPNTPVHPRITNTTDLSAFLQAQGIDAAAAIDGYTNWSDVRGFTGTNRLFGTASSTPADTTQSNAILRAQSNAGNASATQTLAAQILFTDSFGAIELYRRAAQQGSVFALLRIASLLEALDTVGIENESADPVQQQRIADITASGVDNSLRLTAFGYVVTAIRDGGIPIIDHALHAWLNQLGKDITNEELVAVCAWSERTLYEIAKGRAHNGKPPVMTDTPPILFTIPGIADHLPCSQTAYPIENLLDLTHCTVTEVRNSADEALNLHICLMGQVSMQL
jgi:hypothetical protein